MKLLFFCLIGLFLRLRSSFGLFPLLFFLSQLRLKATLFFFYITNNNRNALTCPHLYTSIKSYIHKLTLKKKKRRKEEAEKTMDTKSPSSSHFVKDDDMSPTSTAAAAEAQLADIRSEVQRDPLLSLALPLNKSARLVREVEGDEAYTAQALALFGAPEAPATKTYQFTKIRYSRRDGNCFYRCAGFRLCELLALRPGEAPALVATLKSLEPQLTALFGEFVRDFTEVLLEIVEGVAAGTITTTEEVYSRFTSDDGAYLIVALRYIVSAYLQTNADDYAPFVEGLGYATVKDYCSTEVETVDHESDNVQLAAFARAMNVCLLVYGLDRNAGANVTEYAFNDEGNEDGHRLTIELLYMPGHYNLLER